MGTSKLILELLVGLLRLATGFVKEKKRDEIKDKPLTAFDRKFGRLHDDSKPMQQTSNREGAEREQAHSERS